MTHESPIMLTLCLGSLPILAAVLTVNSHAASNSGPSPAGRPSEGSAPPVSGLRPPATPLITHDPYFSVWSFSDRLTEDWPRHWTGKPQALASMIRVDGKTYRLMGAGPEELPAADQVSLRVFPTRTVYEFETPELRVALTFMSPLLPQDLDPLARPVTYLTWKVRAKDGQSPNVSLYYDNTAELVVNTPDQQVTWSREKIGQLTALKMGSQDQPVLVKKGDDLRIDWGYLYVAAPRDKGTHQAVASHTKCRGGFVEQGKIPDLDDARAPRAANDEWPVAATVFDLGKVGPRPVSRYVMLAFDDIYSIEYFRQRLRPYWRRNGAEAPDLLRAAARDYRSIQTRCEVFDNELMEDLSKAGGEKYALLCALAYRHGFAGNKLVADADGQPLLFPKENFSNGCIATVDVLYPMAPEFLLFSPTLAKASLVPVLDYAASERWRFPFAPHDLGTYPKANGQVYGGGERTEENQMPVEESGNMLLLVAAIAKIEGKPDFAGRYWPQLTQWAEYLKDKGLDPANQLCTDDFAGHLAHNVNLSAKAILALGAYGSLCAMRGETLQAASYQRLAKEFADTWRQRADEGDHYRLAFDKPGTWSQKYNLVWDRILGLNLFPDEVFRKEMDFYKTRQNRYGLPLDVRQTYTKLDWTLWTATLTGSREDFQDLLDPVFDFLNETPDRLPMTDWYQTDSAKCVGFRARPVIGGVFLKMLTVPSLWKKWARRDTAHVAEWASLPKPPQFEVVVPTAQQGEVLWRFTCDKPEEGWWKADFEDSAWKQGPAGFGTAGTPGSIVRTTWNTPDLWLRRSFDLPPGRVGDLRLWMHHDEDAEVYLNGILVAKVKGYTVEYEDFVIPQEGQVGLKPGNNVIAVHCHQTVGGQYIDVGLVRVKTSFSTNSPLAAER